MAQPNKDDDRTPASELGRSSSSRNSRSGSERGFAAMDPEQQRRIAREGGKASSESQERDEHGRFAGEEGRAPSTRRSSSPSPRTSRRSSSDGITEGGDRC